MEDPCRLPHSPAVPLCLNPDTEWRCKLACHFPVVLVLQLRVCMRAAQTRSVLCALVICGLMARQETHEMRHTLDICCSQILSAISGSCELVR